MASFRGVDRRFDFKIKNDRVVFLSDYAHHPSEIKQSVLSMRELYKDKKITAIFQPHLYTRTRDFYQDFADSLLSFSLLFRKRTGYHQQTAQKYVQTFFHSPFIFRLESILPTPRYHFYTYNTCLRYNQKSHPHNNL